MAKLQPATANEITQNNLPKPDFDFDIISEVRDEIISDQSPRTQLLKHTQILSELLEQIEKKDFRELAGFKDDTEKLSKKILLVCCVENILKIAKDNNWGLCKNINFIYLFNGSFWALVENSELQHFLGKAAEKMGVDKFEARYYKFMDELMKQFMVTAILPKPKQNDDIVLIHLKNGTYEFGPKKQFLREARKNDFLTYELPFPYNPGAGAPKFFKYLNHVLPDKATQNILSEYLAYVFIRPSILKLEKTLLLLGSGANGKSVFFEIVLALLGSANVSSYSLQNLTNENGYFRAMLANKLVNYASEINGKLETSIFKQLVSGEPVEARLPYGEPFTLTNYAKLIFNCNELPKDVEQTNAYFRRFIIVPFTVTIPDNEQDRELSKKIIDSELSGIFNWVLAGLHRLLEQKRFTYSEIVNKQIELYRVQSDSLKMFLDDEGYMKDNEDFKPLQDLFEEYKKYCFDCNFRCVSRKTFSLRLRDNGFHLEKKSYGVVVYLKK